MSSKMKTAAATPVAEAYANSLFGISITHVSKAERASAFSSEIAGRIADIGALADQPSSSRREPARHSLYR
jgi:hypothetical protein